MAVGWLSGNTSARQQYRVVMQLQWRVYCPVKSRRRSMNFTSDLTDVNKRRKNIVESDNMIIVRSYRVKVTFVVNKPEIVMYKRIHARIWFYFCIIQYPRSDILEIVPLIQTHLSPSPVHCAVVVLFRSILSQYTDIFIFKQCSTYLAIDVVIAIKIALSARHNMHVHVIYCLTGLVSVLDNERQRGTLVMRF